MPRFLAVSRLSRLRDVAQDVEIFGGVAGPHAGLIFAKATSTEMEGFPVREALGAVALERSFAPVWDAVGNLVLTYNNVAILKQTKMVAVACGETVNSPGVPQPGQVDLLAARRALVKDLGFGGDGLTAAGTQRSRGLESRDGFTRCSVRSICNRG